MDIPGKQFMRQTARRIKRRLVPQSFVLMYHRIGEVACDPWSMYVSPQNFAEQLHALNTYFRPLPLQQLVGGLRDRRVPRGGVVVTFDDGYADNLYHAKPLLERYQVPATVFVVSGQIASERGFWWDEFDRIVLRPGNLPASLALSIGDTTYSWNLGPAASYSVDEYRRDATRFAWEGEPHSRLAFYYALWGIIRPLPAPMRQQALDALQTWADTTLCLDTANRTLTAEEIRTLHRGGLVEIGAHTVTHPMLPAQDVDIQRSEIAQSKRRLEELLDEPVVSFSYPFGEYSPDTIAATQDLGFESACTTAFAGVVSTTDRFQLPRFEVRNWNGKEFISRLSAWLYE